MKGQLEGCSPELAAIYSHKLKFIVVQWISLIPSLLPLPPPSLHTRTVEGIPPAFDLTDGEPMDTVVSLDAFSTEGTLTGNLVLPCSVTGTPAPTVRWFRIEEDGTETELGAALITGRSNSLVLNVTEGVEATRTGLIYYCLATNMIGPEGSEYEAILRSRDVNVTYTCK